MGGGGGGGGAATDTETDAIVGKLFVGLVFCSKCVTSCSFGGSSIWPIPLDTVSESIKTTRWHVQHDQQ